MKYSWFQDRVYADWLASDERAVLQEVERREALASLNDQLRRREVGLR
jgi:hypothetical protein